ncbi:retrovirus-related pol polyprotein from transposon TNT 1-94 [Tanacetum coccineum]
MFNEELRECKEKKQAKDSQWFKDKALLMEAKEKGTILDEEAEAFLADVECTSPYAEPLAITTTTAFEVSHEDAYDSDVDEAPHAVAAFMANLMNLPVSQEIHGGEQLDSDVDSVITDHDNTIPYHQYQLNNEVESVPTDVSFVVPGGISMITILDDLRTTGYAFIPKDSEIEKEVMKRPGFDLQQDNSKRQKTGERSVSVEEHKDKEQVEPSQEEIQEMKIILPEEGMHVEALQTKYPLIDWEIHSEDIMKFWKIIRVGNYTEVYQTFTDMLKNFDRYDLVKLWELIKERFNTTEPIDDKERELWVELKRLFKPDTDDLMELQSHMHDPLTWILFSKKPLTIYKRKDRKLKDISTGSPPNTETKAVNDLVNVNDLSANQLDPNKNWVFDVLNSTASSVFQCRNDQFAVIVGYGLEVAFRKYTCYIRNKDKVDLLKGSRTTNLYSISLKDMMEAYPVCLLSKASSTKSWLWHRRLNHLNFRTLNELARKDLVRGLPKLKYEKEHLCPSCQLGKSKKSSHPLKTVNTNTEVLNTLYMDLCGPIRVESINGKKYILVIVDDYTIFGWVIFLRTKDETPEVIKKFIILMQRALNATVRYLRTDNGTELVNKTLTEFYESVGITHNTSVPRTLQQNGVVERWNRTLMEAARTMLIFAKAPMFLWAEVVATACYTLNRSLVHTLHGKTYYELLKGKKPEVKCFRVFGSLCYPTNDYDDLGNLKAKADIGIFVGYAPTKKAYRIYNKRPRKIQETVHVTTQTKLNGSWTQRCIGPEINNLQSGRIGYGLVTTPTTPGVLPTEKQLSELFQPLFDEDEEFPPDVHPHLVNVAPSRAPETAPDSPSTTTVTEDAPAATTITSTSQTSPPNTGINGPEHTFTTSGSESFKNSVTNEFNSEASSFGTVNVNPTLQNNPPILHGQK